MQLKLKISARYVKSLSYRLGIDDFEKTQDYLEDWAQISTEAISSVLKADLNRIEYMKKHDVLTAADEEEVERKAEELYKGLDTEMYVRTRAAVENALAESWGNEKSAAVMRETLTRINDPLNYIKDLEGG